MDSLTPAAWEINVSHKVGCILWAPVRTGARTTFAYFHDNYDMVRETCRDPSRPHTLTHAIQLPDRSSLHTYYKLLLVRNPYSRLLSIWKWQMDLDERIHGKARCTFEYWLKEEWTKFGNMSIASTIPYDLLEQVTHFIHLEDWENDVASLPFTPEIVNKPVNRYRSGYAKRDKIAYYTPGLLRRVAQEYAQDFVIGDYDPDAAFDTGGPR